MGMPGVGDRMLGVKFVTNRYCAIGKCLPFPIGLVHGGALVCRFTSRRDEDQSQALGRVIDSRYDAGLVRAR